MAEVGVEVSSGLPLEELQDIPEDDGPPDEDFLAELPQEVVEEVKASDEEAGDSEEAEDEVLEAAEEDTGEPSEEETSTPRAQKRIQNLVSSNKELQEQLAQQQQQYQQYIAHLQQQQAEQQRKFQEEQLALQRQQLELARQRDERVSDENLSEIEKFKRSVLQDARSEAESLLQTRVSSLEQQLNEAKSAQERAYQEAERQRRVAYYATQADAVLKDAVYRELDPQTVSELGNEFREHLMTYAAAYGQEPKAIVPRFKKFLDRYAQAKMQKRASTGGKKATARPGAPKPVSAGRDAKRKSSWPTPEQLRKANLDTAFDWIAAGEPELPPA